MLAVSQRESKFNETDDFVISCTVPGAYDMPIVVDSLLKRTDIDAVVTLGAIIKGQTKHDEVISHSSSSGT